MQRWVNLNMMNFILKRSNSFNYYKNNYEKMKNENHDLKSKNKKLQDKNNNLQKSINKKNLELKELKKEVKKLYYHCPKDIGRKWFYNMVTGKELDLENPKDFNEKINWLIVNKYGDREGKLTDKNLVKDYIRNKNIKDMHIPKTYKTYKNSEDINLDELPEKFVLKCNHGSGSVFICQNKNDFDIETAKVKLQESLNENYAYRCLEYHYENINPCIIAEEYLDDKENVMPIDYKFFSFNGHVDNIQVCSNRDKNLKLDDFDTQWDLRDFTKGGWKSDKIFEKPKNLEKMISIAEELGKEFPFVRVDLYEINGKIYFGELTFTPGNATIRYYKQEALDYLGEQLELE